MKKYDFIIAGGGMAGLSLAYYLLQSPLCHKSILILEREPKNENDRTWCFWEHTAKSSPTSAFNSIVFRTWNQVFFHGTTYEGSIQMKPYQYKMIRSIDFYEFIQAELAKWPNVEQKQVTIERIKETPQGGFVIADNEPYLADYVFDSTYALKLNNPDNHNLLQHFKGWVITTEKPCFNSIQPTIMDFRITQHNDCRFMYILPFNERTALVEYTIFNDKRLTDSEYDSQLQHYIDQYIDTGTYRISETEYGVIPMSDEMTDENPSEHIIRIGTSGGFTKASTGYTFFRTQRYLQKIVQNIVNTNNPNRRVSWIKRRFKLYDSIFLNVLANNRHPADDVFTLVYTRNQQRIFAFLDEDTRFIDEIRLFSTLPFRPFLSAFFAVLTRKLTN